jgi:hypothetical protein
LDEPVSLLLQTDEILQAEEAGLRTEEKKHKEIKIAVASLQISHPKSFYFSNTAER